MDPKEAAILLQRLAHQKAMDAEGKAGVINLPPPSHQVLIDHTVDLQRQSAVLYAAARRARDMHQDNLRYLKRYQIRNYLS